MSESLLETVEVATADEPRLAVIWLHGLGADGHDFEPIVAGARAAVRCPLCLSARAAARRDYQRRYAHARVVRHSRAPGHEHARGCGGHSRERGRRGPAHRSRDRARYAGRADRARGVLARRRDRAASARCARHAPLAGVLALSTYLPLAGSLEQERSMAQRGHPHLPRSRHGRRHDSVRRGRGDAGARSRSTATRSSGTPIRWRMRCARRRSRDIHDVVNRARRGRCRRVAGAAAPSRRSSAPPHRTSAR